MPPKKWTVDVVPQVALLKANKAKVKAELEAHEKENRAEVLRAKLKTLRAFWTAVDSKYKSLPHDVRIYINPDARYGGIGGHTSDWRKIIRGQITALAKDISADSPTALRLAGLTAWTMVVKKYYSGETWAKSSGSEIQGSPAERFIIENAVRAGFRVELSDARTVVKKLGSTPKSLR